VHEVVWTGAGSHRHVLAIAPSDLVRLTRARSADVAAEDT
jgi:prolyl-tRNA editing enzyme YbaK/EbsC (Cys-tRNA(Pro) deacylase)